ncbi:MAG: hypothetical protein M2R45_00316 [Verrucomicrobia subdivision 3 bacterium]|nr:hypothetical protein [Limisphaerales bacterium]MCS1412925.1 hypothetical protein [Limisphaerales bacterium]
MIAKYNFELQLFYSYSHKDSGYREDMEKALKKLEHDGSLTSWHDGKILPGQSISNKIKKKLENSDIIVFLMSQDFIASNECRKEWSEACNIKEKKPRVALVPVILKECAWRDIRGMSDLKALPEDAKPVAQFDSPDTAWQQVYEGIKNLTEKLAKDFTLKDEFRKEVEKTKFIAQEHISLQEIFVFPQLSYDIDSYRDKSVRDVAELLRNDHVLIYGEQLSGKTTLCRHLFLTLVEDDKPVIYIDLETVTRKAKSELFQEFYQEEFHGNYTQWEKQSDKKSIILDNLTKDKIKCLSLAQEHFTQIIAVLSSTEFFSYFKDESQLAEFKFLKINPFTHVQQEQLIKKRAPLSNADQSTASIDIQVDKIEEKINAVMTQQKIIPRYPFYILSILQTLEGFMPTNLTITSYGHCYHVLILSHLIKSGIEKTDDKTNMCFNFLEHWAFEQYKQNTKSHEDASIGSRFEAFISGYKPRFIIKDSILNRLKHPEYGLIRNDGEFRDRYTYYFFLGKYLANLDNKENKAVIQDILERSYTPSNSLILLFIIHHTSSADIIDDIVLQSMCTLDNLKPAKLDKEETQEFDKLINQIPDNALSQDSAESERTLEREGRDRQEEYSDLSEDESDESMTEMNDLYRLMKNNEILGQVLSNRHGNMERKKLTEIIEAVMDGGLRLVRRFLFDQSEINAFAAFLHERYPEENLEEIKQLFRFFSFIWTISHIEKAVSALNERELKPLIQSIIEKKKHPAYKLIDYFLHLSWVEKLSKDDAQVLKQLLQDYSYPFMKRVISLKTQHYINTHRIDAPVVQKICSLLEIEYKPRLGLRKN